MSKTIVITGAGSGLGKALAERFAADGENVVLIGRTASKLEAVARELGDRAMVAPCDISSAEAVNAAFAEIGKRFPRIDVLINNAAVIEIGLFEEQSEKQIWDSVNTNLSGTMFCSQAALRVMDRGGQIINVSSEALDTPYPHHVAYQATKAGIERMSHFLQMEIEHRGVRITVVRAGEMVDKQVWDFGPNAALPQNILRFLEESKVRGLDLATRPKSDYRSCTSVFRSIVDQPSDVQITTVHFIARPAN